jgi:ribbon-helix-helix CopG family protein
MDRTLTIRLDRAKVEALTRRARALGKTRSELVRELIDKAVTDQPLGRRLGHLRGSVELPRIRSGWRRELKERNWR